MPGLLVAISVMLWAACCSLSANAASGPPVAASDTPAFTSPPSLSKQSVAAVVLDGRELFLVRGVSAYPANKRAAEIAARIEELAADPSVSPDSLRTEQLPDRIAVMSDHGTILNVFREDAQLEKISEQLFAETAVARIREAMERYREDRSTSHLVASAAYALGVTLLVALLAYITHLFFEWLNRLLEGRYKSRLDSSQMKVLKLVRTEQLWTILCRLTNSVKIVLWMVLFYVYLQQVMGFFPWTRGLGSSLLSLFLDPLQTIGGGFVSALPKIVFLVILFFVTRYFLKITRLFFISLAVGSMRISGFEHEWSMPTYRLVRMLVIALALVVAYPYIPGSSSEAFKAISIFLGVIFSLGSSSFISNIIAGHTLPYRRAFKVGDRIKVGEHIGDVTAIRVLVTHLRTVKNEEIVIPNSIVLNSNIVNYSSLAQEDGLILHTTVGIGYEVPWRQVHAMLLAAAERTEGLLEEPEPFVLQKSLGDFAVNYELNVHCADASESPRLYDRLHQNIQDVFNEYEVQIMTPAYESDTPEPKIVPKERWYAEPARPPSAAESGE